MSSADTQDYGVVLFDSTQRVLKAEKMLKRAGVATKLIPVPRQISSDCGVCLRFLWRDRCRVEGLLAAKELSLEGIQHLGS